MILRRLGLIHKNQRGVALIELIIAFLITGIITGGITMTIFQVFDGNTRSSNHMIAVRQAQNAGYWLSRDAQMAQSVELGASSGFPLTLIWEEYSPDGDGDEHYVVYTLLEDNKLQRSYSIDGGDSTLTIVAQYIVAANASGKLTLIITATVGDATEIRTYKVTPRPS